MTRHNLDTSDLERETAPAREKLVPSTRRLDDRVVVVTGAAGRLGSNFASAIARAGGIPVLVDIDEGGTLALALAIRERFGVEAMPVVVDITDDAAVRDACHRVMETFARIDGLVNNAARNPTVGAEGLAVSSRLELLEIATWNLDLAVGLTGAVICAKHFGTAMHETSAVGSIVNISSDLGIIAPDQRLYEVDGLAFDQQPVKPVSYSVVKAGLIGLTKYLSTYWTRDGATTVRANALCPGGVEGEQDQAFLDRIVQRIPMGRMARADEYDGIVTFLLSDDASYVNGAIMAADGGRSAW